MAGAKRITLSLREQDVGGGVKAVPSVSDEAALAAAQHLVLLIHGYNNDRKAAADAYAGFHARQQELDPDGRYGIGRVFVEVYWPGDADWGMASFLFYMGSVDHAVQSAECLARYLAERFGANGVRIDIVAHSMGCRLGMELLRALAGANAALDIARIVFMAGAAPTFMLEQQRPARRLRPSYDHVLREGARSLYSGADSVLAFAFPAGQSLAPGEEGWMPVALGHTFWADTTVPLNLGQEENPQAGHGDYWGWNTDPKPLHCAQNAAQAVRSFLQFPSAGSRTIGERPLVESSAIAAREMANKREIAARETARYWAGW